jgi:hypothetical protein
MALKKTCPNCKAPHSKLGVYCCRKCYVEFGKSKENAKEFRGVVLEHPCLHCGATLHIRGHFCNNKCYFAFRKAHKENWKELLKENSKRKCLTCGKDFEHPGSYYCSPECANKRKASHDKICPRCQKPFTHKRWNYCSKECADAKDESTPETNRKKSISRRAYLSTPRGVAELERLSRVCTEFNYGNGWNILSMEEYAVDIPVIRDDLDYENYFDGYPKAEDW